MFEEWDQTRICRDEHCEIEEIHAAHRRMKRQPVFHRSTIDDGRLPKPKELLAECIRRAIGDMPTMMQWIQRDVRDDYGAVSDRSVYRYVKRFVQSGQVLRLDLDLTFSVYINPRSRLLTDRASIREYMLASAGCIPTPKRPSWRTPPAWIALPAPT